MLIESRTANDSSSLRPILARTRASMFAKSARFARLGTRYTVLRTCNIRSLRLAEQALVELLQSTEKLAEEREKVPILMHVSVHNRIPCGKHDAVGRFAARLRCHGGEIAAR